MTDDTPAVLYVSIDRSGLSPVPVASFHKHMGAEEWIPRDAVRVKPLEWSNHYATMMATYTEAIQATAFGLQYRIFFAPEDGGDWYAIAVMPGGKRVAVDTLEAAKAAAQADYEARILAALAALPAPDEGEQDEGEG